MQVIIERYYPVILYYARKYAPDDLREDAIQEGNLALFSAVKNYNLKKASFSTFASLCVKRAVIAVLRGKNRKKDIPDELMSSIEELELIDANTPEKILIDRENLRTLTDNIKVELSSLEYRILQLHLSGNNYSQIALKLEISEKSVDNALSRVRKKLKSK